jgi:preprotein translocase subunit SecE
VARDRQRAKARKQRRAQSNPGPKPTEPHRANVPGELDHASGEVEQFESALVAGAGGEPVDETDQGQGVDAVVGDELGSEDELTIREEIAEAEAEIAATDDPEVAAANRREIAKDRERATEPAGRGGNRFIGFLRASWAELQRVQWPDRRQVAQATAVVLGFVVIAGAYLGLADWVAQRVVDIIL